MSNAELLHHLVKSHPDFKAAIKRIGVVAQLPPIAVYELWRDYSKACDASDQSALLWEFVEWKA